MNEIGFNGSWRWISVAAGDVSPSWSRFSISGTRVRGGQIELTPGLFSLELVGGRLRRAVGPERSERMRDVSYQRMLYGARIGYGNTNTSFFRISGFYAADDQDSIDLQPGFGGDGDSPVSPAAENLLLSPEFQLSFLDRAFQFGGMASVSAFTRDVNSNEADAGELGIPGFITNIMPVRNSTRVSFAGNAHASLDIHPADLHLEYRRIEPGFKTMGVRSTRDDNQSYAAALGLDLFDSRLRLENRIELEEDNLLGDRVQTREGILYNTDATLRVTNYFSLSGGYGLNRTESRQTDPDVESGSSDYTTHSGRMQAMFTIQGDDLTQNINLSSFFQTFSSVNRFGDDRREMSGETLNGTVSYSINFRSGLRLNTGLNALNSNTGGSDIVNLGLNAGGGYTFLDGKLSTNLDFRTSRNKVSRPGQEGENGGGSAETINWQYNASARINYRVFDAARLQFSVRTNNNLVSGGAGAGFNELESRISFSYRF